MGRVQANFDRIPGVNLHIGVDARQQLFVIDPDLGLVDLADELQDSTVPSITLKPGPTLWRVTRTNSGRMHSVTSAPTRRSRA